MNEPEIADEKTIAQYASKYNIPPHDSYVIDTVYLSFLRSFDNAVYKKQIRNHFQPLQALYYKASGELQSFQISSYADGFPNFNWEKDGILKNSPQINKPPSIL